MRKTVLLFLLIGILESCSGQSSNLQYVDPTIGNVGQLLEPTRPTVHQPNQMVRMAPIRKDHLDQYISSFPLNIVSHRLGEVFSLKPGMQPISAETGRRRLRFDHGLESIHPWHYSTYLLDEEITVEFTPGKKTGMYRFSFPASKEGGKLLFENYNDGPARWHFISATELEGMETWHGDVKIYLYGVFNIGGKTGLLQEGKPHASPAIEGKNIAATIQFPANAKAVTFAYAVSNVSAEQARKNFEHEFARVGTNNTRKGFDELVMEAKKAWELVMKQIQVEGGTEAQKRSFYTALYRCNERMVDISEDGAYYSGFSKSIQRDTRPFYVDDWSWDSYLAHHPLRMILNPKQEEDMLQSYVRMYEQSGWMPTFPVLFGEHDCMNGFHSSIVFLDAYRKGLRNFDVEKAYAGIRKNATSATMLPWRNGDKNELDDFYHANGYFPALRAGEKETNTTVHPFEKRQSVAVTLGHSYDDWALAELAVELGKKDDHTSFAPRGKNYKTLWHPQQQLFLPKDKSGKWIPIDPKFDGGMGGREFYDENNGWTYLWQVQQDLPGLIELFGGKKPFEQKLDQLFSEGLDRSRYEFWGKFPDATGLVGQFSMGNEPSFHIPYLYNFTDAPWKTQQRVRFLLDVWFKDNIFGIPGDEDGGGMSAFVVFSSMGFYPVTPGLPIYTIGSPVFSKVNIQLPNGKSFRITAKNSSERNKYIQWAKFNGAVLNTPWFTHEQLVAGGHLELEMGPYPNKTWGLGNANPDRAILN
jgi:predicted alpha-1,2-mannosidase